MQILKERTGSGGVRGACREYGGGKEIAILLRHKGQCEFNQLGREGVTVTTVRKCAARMETYVCKQYVNMDMPPHFYVTPMPTHSTCSLPKVLPLQESRVLH